MTEQPTEQTNEQGDKTPQIPKFRLDQESRKRQAAEEKAREAERKYQELIEQRENEESEKDRKKGEFERIAERAQKKAENAEKEQKKAEKERDEARRDLETYKRRVAFSGAAAGVVRAEAINDAFGMIPPEDWEGIDHSDAEKVKRLAQQLVESRPYLADNPRGAGSGGS